MSNESTTLQEDRLLSVKQIIGDKKADPPIEPIISISRSTFFTMVKSGLLPAPVSIGPRLKRWRAKDIRKIVEEGVQA